MSGRLTNQDHEIADLVVGIGMPMRLDDVAEGERAADHRAQVALLDERSEELEVVAHRFGGAIRM